MGMLSYINNYPLTTQPHYFLVGLTRTGKSCRLRWVNYLHPDLKRGKMTPQEQRLVMELHSKWGNRWSRIARKLPGRTDNEIKNYWRTHMRKKRAQEKKHATASPSPSPSPSSSCCDQSSSYSSNNNNNNNNHDVDSHSHASKEVGEYDYDTGDLQPNMINQDIEQGYSMDDIWKDIAMSEEDNINLQQPIYDNCFCPLMPSPSTSWDYSLDPLWVMSEQESNILFPSYYDQQGNAFLTG